MSRIGRHSPRQYTALFGLFQDKNSGKTARVLSRIGTIGLIISPIGFTIFSAYDNDPARATLATIGGAIAAVGGLLGLFMFVALGIHSTGISVGKTNFLSATLHVVGRTFLYLFLPAIIITAIFVGILLLTGVI